LADPLTEGTRRMLGAYELAGFLSVVGRPARVLDTRPVDLGMRDAHVIRVSGSPIDRISLRMQGVVGPRQLLGAGSFMASVGPVPLASRGVLPVQAHLLLDGADDPGPAELRWQTTGFLRKERVGISWRGGPLADALEQAPGLSDRLLSELGLHDGISVMAERARVRVVLRRSVTVEFGIFIDGLGRRHATPWSPALLDALETIAAHARGWVRG
jgi:hypothetical protein